MHLNRHESSPETLAWSLLLNASYMLSFQRKQMRTVDAGPQTDGVSSSSTPIQIIIWLVRTNKNGIKIIICLDYVYFRVLFVAGSHLNITRHGVNANMYVSPRIADYMFWWVCVKWHIYMYDYDLWCMYDVRHVCESNMCFCWLLCSHRIPIRGPFKKDVRHFTSYEKLLSHFVSQLCAEFMMTMGYCLLGPGGKVAPKQS